MRSIEAALARDFANRGAVIIPLVFLGMVALPVWIFESLSRDVLRPTTMEGVVLHVTLTLAMGFVAAVAVFQAQGKLARFFVRPISATRLVACQMALGMATIALMYVGSASLVNLVGAGWPLLGPALFLATALACALTAIWSFEGNVLGQLAACTATSIPLIDWFSRCYGATLISGCKVMWQSPSAVEVITLAGISAAAYALAVVGVTRTRRGDLWDFAEVGMWWDRRLARGPAASSFSSPKAALLWSEWREKFGPLPACFVALVVLAALGTWSAGYMPTKEMLGFVCGMPIMLLMMVMPLVYGLVLGNCGKEPAIGMKHVLATRPVSDEFLARILLCNCATALLWAWGTWLVAMAAALGLAYLSQDRVETLRQLTLASFNRWKDVLPIALVPAASWTFTALMATITATGRRWFYSAVLFGLFGLVLAFVAIKAFVSPSAFGVLSTMWLVLSGGLYLAGTAWAFMAAIRRGLISGGVVVPAVAAWVVVSIVMVFAWPRPLEGTGVWLWHMLGFLSLGILPFAAMPLAVRWNRHR